MTLEARITSEAGQPWLWITTHHHTQGELCVYDAPLNLASKQTISAEIEWAHDKTGMARPDLYDAFRAYQASTRERKRAYA